MMIALEGANNFINRYALLAINLLEGAEEMKKKIRGYVKYTN